MWRYVVPAVLVLGGFLSVIALDDRMREPSIQFDRRPPPVEPLTLTTPSEPIVPPQMLPPLPSELQPLPPAITVAPPPPIAAQPAPPAPPEKPPIPKPRAKSPPVARAPVSRPPRAEPSEPPPPSIAEDVAMARQWVAGGSYSEARQMLARLQTRMVLQPVTPDQPDRSDLNAAATMIGIAMRQIDSGDMRRALHTLNDICQMERCSNGSRSDTNQSWSRTDANRTGLRTDLPQSWPSANPQQQWSGYEPR